MGIQPPSFKLELPNGPLPANAGLVTSSYNADVPAVTHGESVLPTTTIWGGRLSDHNGASSFAVLRPAFGDWPVGTLHIVARGWDRVIAETDVTVGPAVEGSAPTCAFVSGRLEVFSPSHPGGGTRPPTAGFSYAGLNDPYGPIVSLAIEYTIAGDPHVYKQQDIAAADQGGGAIMVSEKFHELKRLVITNVIGKSLELVGPFPHGVSPGGPIGIRL